MTRHAVIDLGSNTIRLVIYDVSAKALAAYREERKHDASGSIGKHDHLPAPPNGTVLIHFCTLHTHMD